jgi:hypothetical protein
LPQRPEVSPKQATPLPLPNRLRQPLIYTQSTMRAKQQRDGKIHPFALRLYFALLYEHHFSGGAVVARVQPEQIHARGHASVAGVGPVPDQLVASGGQFAAGKGLNQLSAQVVHAQLYPGVFRQVEGDRGTRIEGIGVVAMQLGDQCRCDGIVF